MDKEAFTEKIRKLLALSTSPNQHEAEAAMAKATQLMTEHQIVMGEVLERNIRAGESKIGEGKKIVVSETYRSFTDILARTAGIMFDCGNLRVGQAGVRFVGFADDVKLAEIMFDYLFESWKSIVSMDTKNWRLQLYYPPRQYEIKQFKIAHGQGFSHAVLQRARLLVAAREKEVKATGTSLIILKNQLIEQYTERYKPARGKFKQQYEGFNEGYTAGQNIPLTTAINQTKKEIEHD